jgi:hypothetical protein
VSRSEFAIVWPTTLQATLADAIARRTGTGTGTGTPLAEVVRTSVDMAVRGMADRF